MKLLLVLGLLVSSSAFALNPGDSAPDFAAPNQDGKIVHLSDFKGKSVLLYFYPKDDTRGCTAEAQGLRDRIDAFKKVGAVVLGVSRQDAESHQRFRAKYKLPFDLLVDSDGKLGEKFGVGAMPIVGFFKRQSVLIGPDGKIRKFYPSVDPEKHADEVLSELGRP
jgi:peroxiredoxin Q/BCP